MARQFSVSVVMCTYNGEQFIDEQVQSILQQDTAIAEIIIVDDSSTDGTWGKLKIWQRQYPVIRLFQNETNLGYNKNFEKAIQLATSDLISFADQDDIWLPQKIRLTIPAFEDAGVMLAHCRSVQLRQGKLDFKKTRLQHHYGGNDVRRFFFFNHVMGHDAIFRRELVREIVPIPMGMSYDWWIAVNAVVQGSIASIPQFLVHHRIHGNNNFFSSSAASKKKELDLDETLQIIAGIPALQPADQQFLQRLISLIKDRIAMPAAGFSKPLFRFLYKYRHTFFGHKRRLLPVLTYLKSACKYARMQYRGRGMSI